MTISHTEMKVRSGTLEDVPAVTVLTNAVMLDELGSANLEVEELTEQWSQSYFTPERDSCVIFNADGTLVAAAECWSEDPYAYPFFWGAVHPEHKGNGYGTRLLDWAKERGQLNITLAPPDALVALQFHTEVANEAAIHLLERQGFEHTRSFYQMKIVMDPANPPAEPVLPEGVRIRKHVSGQDDHAVWEAMQAGFADHWGFTPSPYERFREGAIDVAHFDPEIWFLAVADTPEGEKIVGGSLCRDGSVENADEGHVSQLAMIRDYRRKGIALALLQHTFRAFLKRGTDTVTLGVDASSLTGATRLYEKAGMHITHESRSYEMNIREGKDLRVQTLTE